MPVEPADTIFRHPRLRPVAYDAYCAGALAVRDGRVVAVGTPELMQDRVGPATEVVDLPGALVQPAFHDAHLHLLHFHGDDQVDLGGVGSPEELWARLAGAAAAGGWGVGTGLDPLRAERIFATAPGGLEAAFPGTAFLLITRDAHGAWVSRAGLDRLRREIGPELACASAQVLEPRHGLPGGAVLLREAALGLARAHIPEAAERITTDALARRMGAVLRAGIACGHEAMIEPEDLPVLHNLFSTHDLRTTGRIHGLLHARAGAWAWLKELAPRRHLHEGRLTLAGVKVFLDGSIGSGSAWMHPEEPPPCMDPGELVEIARFCHERDFQLAIHAIGLQAVRTAIDVISRVRPEIPATYRNARPIWRIEHAEFIDAECIGRAAKMGLLLSLQPLHLREDALFLREHHAAELRHIFPWAELGDGGAAMAFGSDAPLAPCSPLEAVAVACGPARRRLLGIDEAPLALHALSREVALHAHTAGGALASLGCFGSAMLLSGELADFVVLDRDPMAGAPEDVADTRVLETWLGGKRARPAAEEPEPTRGA